MKKSDENCNMSGSGERNNQSFILIQEGAACSK